MPEPLEGPRLAPRGSPPPLPCLLLSGAGGSLVLLGPRPSPHTRAPPSSVGLAPFQPDSTQSSRGHVPPVRPGPSCPEHPTSGLPWPRASELSSILISQTKATECFGAGREASLTYLQTRFIQGAVQTHRHTAPTQRRPEACGQADVSARTCSSTHSWIRGSHSWVGAAGVTGRHPSPLTCPHS